MSNNLNHQAGKFTVSEVEERTGVPASSLRQWERRYGFPNPERSGSGYRYYSESDVESIGRMRDLVADGVPPSRAAVMIRDAFAAPAGARSAQDLARELGDSLRALDAGRADGIFAEAVSLHPIDAVLLEVMRPALIRIGDLWHAGEVSVATEHFASNFMQGRLRAVLRVMPTLPRGQRVVVACAPGERHEMGSLILAIFLKRAGLGVIYLGADTPIAALAELARDQAAEAVLLSVTSPDALARLRAERSLLRSIPGLLVLGGEAVSAQPEVAAEVGGVFLGNDVRKVVPELEALLAKGRRGSAGA